MRLIKLFKAALVKGENVIVECKALQEQVKTMEKSGWSRSAKQAEKGLPKKIEESKVEEPKVEPKKVQFPKAEKEKSFK